MSSSLRWLAIGLIAWCAGCSADIEPREDEVVDAQAAALAACTAVDDEDTTCNDVDDDCDGEVDEDCDYGPADCPAGSHVISGDHRDNFLWGTRSADCILGYGGNDVLWGLSGNDVLVGGPGNDALAGVEGDDQLFGDRGDDALLGGSGDDRLDGGEGNDVLQGGAGRDQVSGGACHDELIASAGQDLLRGDEGVDRIIATAHHQVDGGGGTDACTGTSCELRGWAARPCFRDSDCDGGKRCVRPVFLCVAESEAPTHDASCDGFDDDCDGHVDEDYAGVATQCGEGSCAATGVTECVDGEVVDSCTAGTPGGSDANCNGVDDDCDGNADEAFASQPTTCGVGACAAAGATACMGGAVQDSCAPGAPIGPDASCDGVDDDCDARADEAYAVQPTSCGVGACAAAGATLCAGGAVIDTCMAGSPSGDDASCNASDDDCDGTVDEAYAPLATSCGVGACAAAGSTACASGVVVDQCQPGTPAADDASCDSIDDDCDGGMDEDYAPLPTTCEANGCSAIGATTCEAGEVVDSCLIVPVCVAEIACGDGMDNDDDGQTDCSDTDCSAAPRCQVQTFTIAVPGTANVWGAGHAVAPGDGALPPSVLLVHGGGAFVTFPSATGTVTAQGTYGPDGLNVGWAVPSQGGIAGYSHMTNARSMVGVFLGPAEPVDPSPAQLSFANGNFTEVAPLVGQMFFIGDGRTGGGELQRFIVPAGATRLFLGTTDLCANGRPGCYGDNRGAWQVQGEVRNP